MPEYEASQFSPPAPVAAAMIRGPAGGDASRQVLLLLDTGADVTLLPRRAVERLGVTPHADQRYELVGFDGARSFFLAVTLDLLFLGRVFRGRYLLTEEQVGIMGRDVLNHVALLLDGPREKWSEHTSSSPGTASPSS